MSRSARLRPSTTPRRRPRAALVAVAVAALGTLAGCADDGRVLAPAGPDLTQSIVETTTTLAPLPPAVDGFTVFGPGNGEDPTFPIETTCDGGGIPPRISWVGAPLDAVELAVSVVDADDLTRVHWLVAGLDPRLIDLDGALLPEAAVPVTSSFGSVWAAPCPDPGTTATYEVTVYALRAPSGVTSDTPVTSALAALRAGAATAASTLLTVTR